MSGLFVFVLFSAMAFMSQSVAQTTTQPPNFLGQQLPESIAKIPIAGTIFKGISDVFSKTTGNVLNPTIDLLGLATSGLLGKNGYLYKFFNGATSGFPLALSGGKSGLAAPIIDTGFLRDFVSELLNNSSGTGQAVFAPLIRLLNIPGMVSGESIGKVVDVLKLFPVITIDAATTAKP